MSAIKAESETSHIVCAAPNISDGLSPGSEVNALRVNIGETDRLCRGNTDSHCIGQQPSAHRWPEKVSILTCGYSHGRKPGT